MQKNWLLVACTEGMPCLKQQTETSGRGSLGTAVLKLQRETCCCCCRRLDGPEAASRFSSGYSGAEQTTVILGKSASWRQHNTAGTAGGGRVGAGRAGSLRAAREGPGSGAAGSPIYANFAPLEQLVEATLTDAGANGGRGGWAGGGQQAAVVPRERGVSGGQGQPLSRAASSPTSHKLALGYMLQPDYILNSTLSRCVLTASVPHTSGFYLSFGGATARGAVGAINRQETHTCKVATRCLLTALFSTRCLSPPAMFAAAAAAVTAG